MKRLKSCWVLVCLWLSACAVDPVLLTGERFIVKGPTTATVGPVIVLEAGAGDGPDKWGALQDMLAQHSVVVSYDRPRLDKPVVSGADIAVHLRQKLQAQGLQPPYLLVGHSIGGPFILSFAMQFPHEVAALVLVDGRPKGFAQACQAADGTMCDIPQWLHPTLPDWVSAEIKGLPLTYRQHGDYSTMPDVPVLVLSADNPPPLAGETFMRVWRSQQQTQASWFRQGRYLLVKNSDHYIHHTHPELVQQEILALWRQFVPPAPHVASASQ